MATGVYKTTKKDGSIYFRSSITYSSTHISLGSFESFELANKCYKEADNILSSSLQIPDYSKTYTISFKKWVILINYRDNNLYFSAPIYVRRNYFSYFLDENIELKFDIEDLFYYSNKQIMKRNGHLFVSEFGMQTNILNRYGIKNYAIKGQDYTFSNNDSTDYRYSNIIIHNPYHGVKKISKKNKTLYQSKIHINGYTVIGYYPTPVEAAIAYNKAIDILIEKGSRKNYSTNFIEEISNLEYANIYSKLKISSNIYNYKF